MIVLKVQAFNIKSSNQQLLPEYVKFMSLQDTALQDQELESTYHSITYACHTTSGYPSFVDASNTKRLTDRQEAYQHTMDLHSHQEVHQGEMECDLQHIWNNYADYPSQ